MAAVVGGVTGRLGGGKFANGAVSAGFAYLFSGGMSAANDERYGSDEIQLPTVKELLDGGQLLADNYAPNGYGLLNDRTDIDEVLVCDHRNRTAMYVNKTVAAQAQMQVDMNADSLGIQIDTRTQAQRDYDACVLTCMMSSGLVGGPINKIIKGGLYGAAAGYGGRKTFCQHMGCPKP
ncbi:hypothetical protein [endosymbiont of unidentified scaly snail isolate Monju]|uniref:hypothetical protein n=1 Tax=endosymbiont of unidentified scaly snail isolate Monju TaxID=1248727 RepID=UPI0011DDA6A7|nr:hypothetical protein [endosymbiont of unidentified scaly snail isolate Monju]